MRDQMRTSGQGRMCASAVSACALGGGASLADSKAVRSLGYAGGAAIQECPSNGV
jgi:hypothetical protein